MTYDSPVPPPVPPFVQDVVLLLGHLEVSTCLFVDMS